MVPISSSSDHEKGLTFAAPASWQPSFFEAQIRAAFAPFQDRKTIRWERLRHAIVPVPIPYRMEISRQNFGDVSNPDFKAKVTFFFATDWEGRAFHLIYYNSKYLRLNSDQSVEDRFACFSATIPPRSLVSGAKTDKELTEIVDLFLQEMGGLFGRKILEDLLDTEWLKVDSYWFETERIRLPKMPEPENELVPFFNEQGAIDWIKFSHCLVQIPKPLSFQIFTGGAEPCIQFKFSRSDEAGIFYRLALLKRWFTPLRPICSLDVVKFTGKKREISPRPVYDRVEELFGKKALRDFLIEPQSRLSLAKPAQDC